MLLLRRQHVLVGGGLDHIGWIQAVWRDVLVVKLLLLLLLLLEMLLLMLDLKKLVFELLLLDLHGIVNRRWESRRHCWVHVTCCGCGSGLLVVLIDLLRMMVVLGLMRSQLRIEKDC